MNLCINKFRNNSKTAMNIERLEQFAQIPQPLRESFGFIEDIKQPRGYRFTPECGCDPGKTTGCMNHGVEIVINYPRTSDFPETAFTSLRRVLKAKNIEENKYGYSLSFTQDNTLSREEFRVKVTAEMAEISAADADGLRRGIYFLEDRICEAEGASVTEGEWHRKPFVRHRISRCFFGPTNRPPFHIDELMDDIDYYPEEYLNKLAHEGVNGLWLTMYFRDLPSSIFTGRGSNAENRFRKLRQVVEKCGRYGIRIYVFLSEPKLFGNTYFSVPKEDAKNHAELLGSHEGNFDFFCVSTETGKKYLKESMEQIFKAVPQLGGVINIMLGEDNGSCVAHNTMCPGKPGDDNYCPRCCSRDAADIYAELASMFAGVVHKYNPDAEYIGWFYAPDQRDDSEYMKRLAHISEKWPEDATLMFNFESGGTTRQLGKNKIVFDYSLAYIGPSKLFSESVAKASRSGAKLQVGCSHEDASIPFIPVPENLYDKYKFLNDHHVSAVMQCWYFGNYPGLMNKAAGELSFEPFPKNGMEFLKELAKPDWRNNADKVAEAWHYFSQAYRKFPANLSFEWYGPLHNCIAWPYHLFPADAPIAPSWLLNQFPEVSGDRIGECLAYHHTFSEALQLCSEMSQTWQIGVDIFKTLRKEYDQDPSRQADINLAVAVGLQMKSTRNLLLFYSLREDMIFNLHNHLSEMKKVVLDEINNTEEMLSLCEKDSRLGYHSEAEGYLFFPEKLRARIKLLHTLLDEDFPRFRINDSLCDEYTGRKITGIFAVIHSRGLMEETHDMKSEVSWQASYDRNNIYLTVHNIFGKKFSIALEPCRLWTPFRIDFTADGRFYYESRVFPEIPDENAHFEGKDLKVTISRRLFDGFYREGFPMRMNIWSYDHPEIHWVEPKLWKSRLLHSDFNPAGAGWLILN